MGIISNSPTMKAPKQSSVMMNKPAGSGSRPVASKTKIPTSAPMDAHTMDRKPANPMK